jgi:phosphopantothenoylcysteine decarboxylase
MANVLLGVTGSVAAIRTPDLYEAFKRAHHQVKVVATDAALYFFDPLRLDPADPARPLRNPQVVILDEDEWPGRSQGQHYQRDDPVLHIELRRWADLFVIAPLDANTLAKLANGLSDNCLTCVWRAWDTSRPVVLAPAMNTLMWEHPLTQHHLQQLATLVAGIAPPAGASEDDLAEWINRTAARLRVVAPQSKRLACGDVGVGAMASLDEIVTMVNRLLSPGPGPA